MSLLSAAIYEFAICENQHQLAVSKYSMHMMRRYMIFVESDEVMKMPAGRVAQLIERYGGTIVSFSALPNTAKKAIRQRDSETRAIDDTTRIKPTTKFGYVEIPMAALKDAVFDEVRVDAGDQFTDFDAYHRWYIEHGDTPNHREVWPIIMDPENDEVIYDGSHRFHSYVRNGIEMVPAVWIA